MILQNMTQGHPWQPVVISINSIIEYYVSFFVCLCLCIYSIWFWAERKAIQNCYILKTKKKEIYIFF